MKNMTLKKWILSGIALALCIVILAFIIYTIVVVVNKDKKPDALETMPIDYEFAFDGKVTINEIAYNVTMNGKDGKFDLVANKLAPITGTYELTQGKGYTFFFNDANGTEVRTQYDTSEKELYFVYVLDLGAARGSGNVKMTWKNETFTLEGEAWADIPSFAGMANFGFIQATMQMVCKADDTFRLFSTDMGEYVAEITGTYSYENGAYVFTIGENTYTSALNEETGLHEVSIPVSIPSYGFDGQAALVQISLTVD